MSQKIYITTEKAGRSVAGRLVPLDGERPKIGFEIALTAGEAEYELLLGTIVEKPGDKPSPVARAAKAGDGEARA